MATKNTSESLRALYIQAALSQKSLPFEGGPATEATDKLGEERYNALIDIYRKILATGEKMILFDLLTYEIHSVRAWAATHSLPLNEKKAREVLEDLSKKHSCGDRFCDSFSAKLTLKEWDKGPLREYLFSIIKQSTEKK